MMEWYYILGIISYGIFIVQFLLSNFFGWGDLDLDIDFDGEPDFGLGDVLSFKGLVHFAMGFSGWLMLAGKVTLTTLAIASVIGFVFIVILYYAYRLCLKFNSEPQIKSGESLVGKEVSISVQISEMEYSGNCITDSGYIPLDRCRLSKPANHTIRCGDILHIDSYKSGIYFIS